jgi:hypothetical protein
MRAEVIPRSSTARKKRIEVLGMDIISSTAGKMMMIEPK